MTHRQILFTDIETMLEFEFFSDVPEAGQQAFIKRFGHKIEERFQKTFSRPFPDGPDAPEIEDIRQIEQEVYEEEAVFMPEFSRIVAISIGLFYQRDTTRPENPDTFWVKSFVGTADPASEKELLDKFTSASNKMIGDNKSVPCFDFLCAHNGKNFDFPFIIKRMIILRLHIPRLLNNLYKKPWEVPLIDTNDIWNSTGKYKIISLDTIAYCLGIPSPKSEMDGSMVGRYFREGKFDEIKKYVTGDVVTLASAYRVMTGGEPIAPESIEYAV